ncbi:MAG: HlyC/CorC family transporter [Arenicella sp.]
MDTKEQPPSSLFTRIINFLYKKFGSRLLKNRKELITIFEQAQESGLMDKEARDTMQRVLQVSDLHAREIMIPKAQIVVVEQGAPLQNCIEILVESSHSRFPVVDSERSKVLGILLAKDMLQFFDDKHRKEFNLDDLLRPAIFVPESKRLNVLLDDFRRNRNHMAIVVDEYGAISGLVTIEDVLEQIVGEIDDEYDEFDEDQSMIRKSSDGGFIIKAVLPIDEFNAYFKTNLEDKRADTMGGLISQKLGRVPEMGDKVTIKKVQFEVLHADSRRVHLMRIIPL